MVFNIGIKDRNVLISIKCSVFCYKKYIYIHYAVYTGTMNEVFLDIFWMFMNCIVYKCSVYEMPCLWNALFMKCPVYKMPCLWNALFMKCPVYKISCLWNALFMKCPAYKIPCLWNVLFMKCPVYEMSCLWNVLFMKYPGYEMSWLWNVLYVKCPVCDISFKWILYNHKDFQFKSVEFQIVYHPLSSLRPEIYQCNPDIYLEYMNIQYIIYKLNIYLYSTLLLTVLEYRTKHITRQILHGEKYYYPIKRYKYI